MIGFYRLVQMGTHLAQKLGKAAYMSPVFFMESGEAHVQCLQGDSSRFEATTSIFMLRIEIKITK